MAVEIKRIEEKILEEQRVSPGQMLPLSTPAGQIELIGTENGFALRRAGSTSPDVRYENGETLTINYPDGRIVKISAVKPKDWIANDQLDTQE